MSGRSADPDHDGIVNILEYAFASDPNVPDESPLLSAIIVSNHFQLRFKRNTLATDLTYAVQTAAAPAGPWNNRAAFSAGTGWTMDNAWGVLAESEPSGSGLDEWVLVSISQNEPATDGAGSFVRVLVTGD